MVEWLKQQSARRSPEGDKLAPCVELLTTHIKNKSLCKIALTHFKAEMNFVSTSFLEVFMSTSANSQEARFQLFKKIYSYQVLNIVILDILLL